MKDEYYRMTELWARHLCGKTTEAEREELEHYRSSHPEQEEELQNFSPAELEERIAFFQQTDVDLAFRKFGQRIGIRKQRRIARQLMRYAALLFLLLLGIIALYHFHQPDPSPAPGIAEIRPGSYQALLTLSDGSQLPLCKNSPEVLPQAGPVTITNTGQEIIYPDTIAAPLSTLYNHLTTPRGGEYHITLADGSRVYLNAASSLKYPVAFGADKREVYLSGEAWFEIQPDSLRPFYVITDATRIRVYGTVFNVNTHPRDKIQTVLVKGRIGITGQQEGREYRMRPSELAEFTPDGVLTDLREIDITPYIAWKSGKFIFENKRLEDILDDLSRWYDVEVFYLQPQLKELRFTGNMPRYEQISLILEAIRSITGVEFRIQGKSITVAP